MSFNISKASCASSGVGVSPAANAPLKGPTKGILDIAVPTLVTVLGLIFLSNYFDNQWKLKI